MILFGSPTTSNSYSNVEFVPASTLISGLNGILTVPVYAGFDVEIVPDTG